MGFHTTSRAEHDAADEQRRAAWREKARRRAERGISPHHGPTDPSWAFAGHEDELHELEMLAAERRQATRSARGTRAAARRNDHGA